MPLPKKSNILLTPFIILTGSMVLLCIMVQILLQVSLNDIKTDAGVLEITREQRTLAHQVVNSVAADNLAGQLTTPPLDGLLIIFANEHEKMLQAVKTMSKTEFFKKLLAGVDSSYNAFSKAILLNANADSTNNQDFVMLLRAQTEYVKKLDTYISAVSGNSDSKVERFRQEEFVLTVLSILIIVLEVIFFFLPAIRKLKKHSSQFKAIAYYQSHIIRQPLANIKGLIEIIDSSKLNDETKEVFMLLQDEADRLDDVIKNTIYSARAE